MKNGSFLKTLSKITLSIIAPILVLLSVEVIAGMFFSDVKVFYDLHPKYLYVTRADFKRVVMNKQTGHQMLFRISSLGYRGDFELQKSRPRVVVYGDSNVQAMFLGEEQTFPFLLERELKQLGKDFEVINAGTSGYGPDQNLLRMKDEISILKPDVIVFHLFADNDFGDLIRNKIFEIKNQELVKRNPRTSLKIKAAYYCARSYICRNLKKTAQKIKGEKSQIDLLKACEEEFVSYQRDGVVDFPMWEDHYDADLEFSPQAVSSQYKVELMRKLIEELKRTASSHPEIRVLLLIQPSKVDLLGGTGVPSMVSLLERAAEETGMDFLSLYSDFRQAGAEAMYNTYDDHWSPEGQSRAATSAANKILRLEKSRAVPV